VICSTMPPFVPIHNVDFAGIISDAIAALAAARAAQISVMARKPKTKALEMDA
jgi:hypothetical protein